MSRPYANNIGSLDGWFAAIDLRTADFREIAKLEPIVSLVDASVKKSIGRVADIPLKCGSHFTGYSVSLAIGSSGVELLYFSTPELAGRPPTGIRHVDDAAAPLSLTCPECGTVTRHNAVWVLKATLGALAGKARTRPVVQVRT
ncbi:hypothetical protein [Arthrobacter sp. 4R501]|uniref:hypothetical protein n=1 Tax=Arthrobacter sp. 4R501 TaxID=2058886 RepID=UPI000CE377C8|nr:hypothetical protein [Arthrobacter sp. 4R501]